MNKIANKLRIGEKIYFGFGLVGLLFLFVIWQYHSTLQNSMNDYQHLNDFYAAKKDKLFSIEAGLLNARQSEKDFLLKHKKDYAQSTLQQILHVQKITTQLADIDHSAQKTADQLQQYLKDYLNHFQLVVASWEKKGLNENSGLQGSFRDAVHALESMVASLHNDKIYLNLLQLRRHEKDYLLRGDKKYIELVTSTIQTIKTQVKFSQFSSDDKTQFVSLLNKYQLDFMALVEQNKHIADVVKNMEYSAVNVTQIINQNAFISNENMANMTDDINNSSLERITIMLWLVLIASLSGIYLALSITPKIVKPLRKMAFLLEELTYSDHIEYMPFQSEGRDEVNAMAGSLNTLTDHRRRFIKWWKNSMSEVEACTQLENMLQHLSENTPDSTAEMQQIKDELTKALIEKKNLLAKEYQEIRKCNEEILKQSALLEHVSITQGDIDHSAKAIHYSANLIQKTLDMLSYNTEQKSF
jgi:methyl-accepting chemotaxis protein